MYLLIAYVVEKTVPVPLHLLQVPLPLQCLHFFGCSFFWYELEDEEDALLDDSIGGVVYAPPLLVELLSLLIKEQVVTPEGALVRTYL